MTIALDPREVSLEPPPNSRSTGDSKASISDGGKLARTSQASIDIPEDGIGVAEDVA
ncbi:MAG: hypothetical protein U5O39_18905 [Gammaproteobacteria bacterium]|nr:hypothetical protein [Gammaproteobacteria bacterium]